MSDDDAFRYHALKLWLDVGNVPLIRYVDLQLMTARAEFDPRSPYWPIDRAVYAALQQASRVLPAEAAREIVRMKEDLLTRRARRCIDSLLPDPWRRAYGSTAGVIARTLLLFDAPRQQIHYGMRMVRRKIELMITQ